MSKPPKVVIPGLNRGAGIPGGYILGRRRGSKQGPAELLNLTQVRAIGIATTTDVTSSTSLVASIAHSETVSLSRSISTSLSAISGSLSGAVSSITSLSSAVSSGLSSTNSTNVTQSTSLSQVSSSLSGAISTTTSLSTAVSTADSNQSTSLSQVSSSLSGTISTNVLQSTSLSQISSSLSGAISSTTSLSGAVSTSLDAKANLAGGNSFTGGAQNIAATGAPLVINSTNGNGNKLVFQDLGVATGAFGGSASDPFIASDGAGNIILRINNSGNAQLIELSGGVPAGPRIFFGPSNSKIEAYADAALSTYNPLELAGSSVILKSGATTIGTITSTAFNLASGIVLQINATQVVGARKTGWSVDTGTSKRTANATYAAGATLTFTNPPTAAEMSALATRLSAVEAALQDYTQTTKAMKDDLHSTAGHGLIGT